MKLTLLRYAWNYVPKRQTVHVPYWGLSGRTASMWRLLHARSK